MFHLDLDLKSYINQLDQDYTVLIKEILQIHKPRQRLATELGNLAVFYLIALLKWVLQEDLIHSTFKM